MMLCNLFNADVRVSTDISKILRIPYSYNCKDEKPIRGKFFNFRDEFDLYDFVDLKAKLEPLNKDNETPKPQKKSTKKKATKMKEVIVNKEPTNDDTNTNEGYKYDDDTINAIKEYYKNYEEKSKMDRRFNNIIHFLEDELLKHRNWQMYGYRDTFIFCIAKVYQNNGYGKKATKEHCIEVNKSFRRYLKDDGEQSTEEEAKLSDKEIENIINYIYDPDNKIIYNGQEVSKCDIKLSNESIKNLLDITPEEQNLYHGVSFFEEHRQLKIKIKTELKKDIYSTKKKPTKQEQLEFIKNNSDLSVYQLAQALNVTTRTILNRKKELKNDDKNKK